VLPGQGLLYTIKATNLGPDTATSVKIRDLFPNTQSGQVESVLNNGQLSFTAEVHHGINVNQIGNCVRLGNQYTVSCDGFGSLDAGDFVIVKLEGKVNPGSTGALINTAIVENFGTNAQATVGTNVAESVTFSSVTKTANPGSVTAGDGSIDYVIRVENNAQNTVNAHNVMINDTLPTGTLSMLITSQPSSNLCQILPSLTSQHELKCGPYTIDNNKSVEIHYTVHVGSNAQDPFVNNLSVTCNECASVQSTSTSTQIHKESDLKIQKEVDKESAIAGQDSLLYTITVTNNGPSDANNVVIRDHMPAGITFKMAGSSPECSYDSQSTDIICNLSNPLTMENPKHTVTINAKVNSSAIGTLVNTASVTSASADSNQANNQISLPVNINTNADLAVSKTGPATAVAGGKITYNLTVTNNGPSNAINVEVEDVLPSGLTLILSSTPGSVTDPSCHVHSGSAICDFGNIAVGTTKTKLIQGQIGLNVAGNLENVADVSSDTDDFNSVNNESKLITSITQPFCGRPESEFAKVIYGTEGNDNIKGTEGDDLIIDLKGNNEIHGKGGNDCIVVGDGNNKIWGGKGDDTIIAGNGKNEIHGQDGNDKITVGDGNNKIWGGKGDDTIIAGNGKNEIHGQDGNDKITSGAGDDKIWGGKGNDIINAGNGNNRVNGNQGDDNITTGSGNDWINTGQGDDTVHAGAGDDKIFGGQGNDYLFGEGGNDIIRGAQGNDHIDGGLGTDTCYGDKGNNTILSCEIEDKKMKAEDEDSEEDENEESD
jgi:uncharacterized repeat protein (TIGR01451 family)